MVSKGNHPQMARFRWTWNMILKKHIHIKPFQSRLNKAVVQAPGNMKKSWKPPGFLWIFIPIVPWRSMKFVVTRKNTSDISLDKFEHVSQPCDVTKIVMVNELELSHHLSVVMSVFSCEKLRNQTIQTQVVGWNVMGFLMQNDWWIHKL